VERIQAITSETLIMELLDKEAEIDCLESGLDFGQPGPVRALSEQICSLRRELLLRMGGAPHNEKLVDELVKLHKSSVNSGEDKSPELRDEIDCRKAQILEKIGDLQIA
jgi:hypothetical protein